MPVADSYTHRGSSPAAKSDAVTLTLRGPVTAPLEASGLVLGQFTDLDEAAIAKLEVRSGRESVELGELFIVRGGRSANVRIEGTLGNVHGLGTGFATGELLIEGDVGDRTGACMTGGYLRVVGSVGHDAGLSMRGGTLRIDGNAGDRLGAAGPGARRGMSGGEIIVCGSTGHEAAMRARRGLIVIGRTTGADLARDIIAGTVVAFGQVGPEPGRGNKRGSIIATGGVDVPSTYRLACTFEPPFLRLLMTYLARRFAWKIRDDIAYGRYRRYCGDAGMPGRGEILEWIPA